MDASDFGETNATGRPFLSPDVLSLFPKKSLPHVDDIGLPIDVFPSECQRRVDASNLAVEHGGRFLSDFDSSSCTVRPSRARRTKAYVHKTMQLITNLKARLSGLRRFHSNARDSRDNQLH